MKVLKCPKLFKPKDINYLPPCEKENVGEIFWFSSDLIARCDPIFNHCDDNHEIEDLLTKAHVISIDDKPDSDFSELVVNFSDLTKGLSFIKRLNSYIMYRWQIFLLCFDLSRS